MKSLYGNHVEWSRCANRGWLCWGYNEAACATRGKEMRTVIIHRKAVLRPYEICS